MRLVSRLDVMGIGRLANPLRDTVALTCVICVLDTTHCLSFIETARRDTYASGRVVYRDPRQDDHVPSIVIYPVGYLGRLLCTTT